jgi:hypothetical protein
LKKRRYTPESVARKMAYMGFANIIIQKISRYLEIFNLVKLLIALERKRIPSSSNHKQRLVGLGRATRNGRIRKHIKNETK